MQLNAKLHMTIVLASAVSAIVGAGGCSPPPPSEDAVLYYLRNARAHGGVRRAWPAGQAYVDGVLKADADLQKELSLLKPLGDPLKLWPPSDPRWQDKAAVAKRLAELKELAEEHPAKRDAALEALGKAIAAVPAGLSLKEPRQRAALADKVWAALAVDEVPLDEYILRLERPLPLHLALFQEVSAAEEQVDSDRLGLAFKDAQREADILAKYAAVKAFAENEQEAWLRYAELRWGEVSARLQSVDKHEQRGEYERLSAEQKHLKNRMEAIAKSYQTAADEAAKTNVYIQKAQPEALTAEEELRLELRLAAETARREHLLADATALKARVDQIMQGPPPATGATAPAER